MGVQDSHHCYAYPLLRRREGKQASELVLQCQLAWPIVLVKGGEVHRQSLIGLMCRHGTHLSMHGVNVPLAFTK